MGGGARRAPSQTLPFRAIPGHRPADVARILVIAQSEKNWVAELAVAGHFGEGELGDELGLGPGGVAHARGIVEG
jgi:hypothetical protein